jgi:hypothetical protein
MDVYDEIVRLRREGRRCALATIIDPLRPQKSPAAVATGDTVRNHCSALSLGSFAWSLRVTLGFVGALFTVKRKIWGARLLQTFPFSPPAEGRGQYANGDYQHGKQNQEP